MAEKTWKSYVAELETTLDLYLVKKAPALPENIKELLVKLAPFFTIVGLVFAVPAVLALFGITAFVSAIPFGAVALATGGFQYMVGMVFLIAILVLEALALPGLFARSKKGWTFIYYSVLVSAVQSLISFNLGGLILGTLIGLYFLFQVKSYYK